MSFVETCKIALNALAANKVRAILTMLGIIIGVSAVITLLALGDGVQRYVADQFIGLGSNLVFVVPEQETPGPPGSDPLVESSLTLRDALYLAEPGVLQGAKAVAPVVLANRDLFYGGEYHNVRILASTAEYAAIRGYEVAIGRMFTPEEYTAKARVVVLGKEAAEELYSADMNPVGTDLTIQGYRFRVIGIFAERGTTFGGSQDNVALIPLLSAQDRVVELKSKRTGQPLVQTITIEAERGEDVPTIILQAEEVLRQRHNIAFRGDDDFSVLTQQDFLDAFGSVTDVLTLFLGAIASISLLVGGIGIMNIMLVSVTERTKEIGLRKAVGASNRAIMGQFLLEAIIIALIGGIIGIILGFLGAWAIRTAVPNLYAYVGLNAVLLAVGFSTAVGVFFGLYPASRAARLNPIQALRFE